MISGRESIIAWTSNDSKDAVGPTLDPRQLLGWREAHLFGNISLRELWLLEISEYGFNFILFFFSFFEHLNWIMLSQKVTF